MTFIMKKMRQENLKALFKLYEAKSIKKKPVKTRTDAEKLKSSLKLKAFGAESELNWCFSLVEAAGWTTKTEEDLSEKRSVVVLLQLSPLTPV